MAPSVEAVRSPTRSAIELRNDSGRPLLNRTHCADLDADLVDRGMTNAGDQRADAGVAARRLGVEHLDRELAALFRRKTMTPAALVLWPERLL